MGHRDPADVTVLVVDDEPDIVEFVTGTLRDAGFRTVSTSDSEHALGLLNGQKFDVLVSDIVMPRVNGLQILDCVKRSDRDTEVVLMSGYSIFEDIVNDTSGKGLAAFLPKPFSTEELVGAVTHASDRTRARNN